MYHRPNRLVAGPANATATSTAHAPGLGLAQSSTQAPISSDSHEANRLAAARLAKRLFQLDGFSRADVTKHLSKVNEFSQLVASEYVGFFNFAGEALDRALRKFVERCVIIGETQERERVLLHFARRYYDCNPHIVGSVDAVHTLTCALMLLNVDLHGGKTSRKMQLCEFVQNLAGLNDGYDFSRELLKDLFHNVKKEALPFPPEEVLTPLDGTLDRLDNGTSIMPSVSDAAHPNGATSAAATAVSVGVTVVNPYLDVPDTSKSTLFVHSVLMRKCVREPGARRPPLGRRSWRLYYAALCELMVYLFKSQEDFCVAFGVMLSPEQLGRRPPRRQQRSKTGSAAQSPNGSGATPPTAADSSAAASALRLHHAYAERAADYRKKENVFRLLTADGAEYLFQAPDLLEMVEWVWRINVLAARLSAPVLPGAVGSSSSRFAARFQRPLLPSAISRLSLIQQLNEHRKRLSIINADLDELQRAQQQSSSNRIAIGKSKSESKVVQQEREEKRKYLQLEHRRFSVYVQLLEKECEKEYAQVTANSESLFRQPISEDHEDEEEEEEELDDADTGSIQSGDQTHANCLGVGIELAATVTRSTSEYASANVVDQQLSAHAGFHATSSCSHPDGFSLQHTTGTNSRFGAQNQQAGVANGHYTADSGKQAGCIGSVDVAVAGALDGVSLNRNGLALESPGPDGVSVDANCSAPATCASGSYRAALPSRWLNQ